MNLEIISEPIIWLGTGRHLDLPADGRDPRLDPVRLLRDPRGLAVDPLRAVRSGPGRRAGFLYTLRRLTVPLLKPTLTVTTVLNVIYVFNSFPIIWVLTEGGPRTGPTS